jgi:uncharacterized protein (TIGR03083 family)
MAHSGMHDRRDIALAQAVRRCQTRSMADLAELIRTEREALIELLETLSPEEWATQSLCDRWTVKAVAAHLAYASAMPPQRMVVELVRARGSINRMIGDCGVRDGERPVPVILGQLRYNAKQDVKPMGMPKVAALADAVVHQLDVRRPLGRARKIPEEAFRRAATFFAGTAFPGSLVVGGNVRKRVAGLKLVADEVEWSYGEGPEVHGSSEAMLLMLAGRPINDEELTGPGASELYGRLL